MYVLLMVLHLLFFALADKHYPRVIHLHVALCDNANQGIVPVPKRLGNGQDPANNLYWGALYGVKTRFKASESWVLIGNTIKQENEAILERLVFKNKDDYVFLVADAYKGAEIDGCIADVLKRSNGQKEEAIVLEYETIKAGGASHLIAYAGHNGLMEYEPRIEMVNGEGRETIILACASESYFSSYLKRAGAKSILQTTGFMAPEAYTLEAAFEAWVQDKSEEAIKEEAAKAYHKYQKCGINAARRLFTTAG